MGSFGAEGGPPCRRCSQLPSVYHSDEFGLLCNRCLQDFTNNHLIARWREITRTHPVLSDTEVTHHIAEFVLGNGLDAYCYCRECNPNWFLHGWVCYGCNWSGQCLLNKREDAQPRLCQVPTYDRLRLFPCMWKIVSEKYANDCCMKYFAGPILSSGDRWF